MKMGQIAMCFGLFLSLGTGLIRGQELTAFKEIFDEAAAPPVIGVWSQTSIGAAVDTTGTPSTHDKVYVGKSGSSAFYAMLGPIKLAEGSTPAVGPGKYKLEVSNIYPYMESGAIYSSGRRIRIRTTLVVAGTSSTNLIAQVDPGANTAPDQLADDVHRIFLVDPQVGENVELWLLASTGMEAPAACQIRIANLKEVAQGDVFVEVTWDAGHTPPKPKCELKYVNTASQAIKDFVADMKKRAVQAQIR